jgi:hypothetical protein
VKGRRILTVEIMGERGGLAFYDPDPCSSGGSCRSALPLVRRTSRKGAGTHDRADRTRPGGALEGWEGIDKGSLLSAPGGTRLRSHAEIPAL